MLSKSMLKNLLMPLVRDNAPAVEQDIITRIRSVELKEGETHAGFASDVKKDESGTDRLVLVVGAFQGAKMVRVVEVVNVLDFVLNIDKLLA